MLNGDQWVQKTNTGGRDRVKRLQHYNFLISSLCLPRGSSVIQGCKPLASCPPARPASASGDVSRAFSVRTSCRIWSRMVASQTAWGEHEQALSCGSLEPKAALDEAGTHVIQLLPPRFRGTRDVEVHSAAIATDLCCQCC